MTEPLSPERLSTSGPDRQRSLRAHRSPAAWALLLFVMVSGLLADLGLKQWTFHTVAGAPIHLDRQELLQNPNTNPIPSHPGIHLLPWEMLDLQLVINRGAVFGIGANRRFFFITFTILALATGLFVFGRFTRHNHRLAHGAIGLILAGGLGNLYDRIVYGVVRDFLHLLPGYHLPFGLHWPGSSPEVFPWVFNTADVMLLSGMGLLLCHMHLLERRRHANDSSAPAAKESAAVTESNQRPA